MKFLDKLLGRRDDPTAAWGDFHQPVPDYNLDGMRFGALAFGDPFACASFLGRPDRVGWDTTGYCELLYARGGFQLDFDKGKFAGLGFLIGPDRLLPEHEAMAFSSPRLCGGALDGVRLSRETGREALERMFGKPDVEDTDEEETILFYTLRSVTMDFELAAGTALLKRWNLYPEYAVN